MEKINQAHSWLPGWPVVKVIVVIFSAYAYFFWMFSANVGGGIIQYVDAIYVINFNLLMTAYFVVSVFLANFFAGVLIVLAEMIPVKARKRLIVRKIIRNLCKNELTLKAALLGVIFFLAVVGFSWASFIIPIFFIGTVVSLFAYISGRMAFRSEINRYVSTGFDFRGALAKAGKKLDREHSRGSRIAGIAAWPAVIVFLGACATGHANQLEAGQLYDLHTRSEKHIGVVIGQTGSGIMLYVDGCDCTYIFLTLQ